MPTSWTKVLSIIGGASTAYVAYCLVDFIYLHFLRPSSLSRYLSSSSDARARKWALVTGASDGIGKGFAQELCSRGFNLVLHGRNAAKLETFKAELNALYPQSSIKLAVLDAHPCTEAAIERLAAELADVPINVLVNNVGGVGSVHPTFCELKDLSPQDLDVFIGLNIRFSTHITRALLPNLLRSQPSLVVNVGSVTAHLPQPWLGVYAGSKAFSLAWSRALKAEMVAEGRNVEVLGLVVGEVQNQHDKNATSLFKCSSRTLARSALQKVGCGRTSVVPYAPHAVQVSLLGLVPDWLVERLMIKVSRGYKDKEAKRT